MADLIAEIAVSEAKFRQQTRKVFDDALKATADFEPDHQARLDSSGVRSGLSATTHSIVDFRSINFPGPQALLKR